MPSLSYIRTAIASFFRPKSQDDLEKEIQDLKDTNKKTKETLNQTGKQLIKTLESEKITIKERHDNASWFMSIAYKLKDKFHDEHSDTLDVKGIKPIKIAAIKDVLEKLNADNDNLDTQNDYDTKVRDKYLPRSAGHVQITPVASGGFFSRRVMNFLTKDVLSYTHDKMRLKGLENELSKRKAVFEGHATQATVGHTQSELHKRFEI